VAPGWSIRETPAGVSFLGDDAQAVVYERADQTPPPLFVIARVSEQALGEADPRQYPAALAAALRKSLTARQPGLTVTSSGQRTDPPKLFTTAHELVVTGPFPELAFDSATGRFVTGVTADGRVCLAAGFAADDDSRTAIDGMIASLEPLATQAPAEAAAAPTKAEAPSPAVEAHKAPTGPAETGGAPAPSAAKGDAAAAKTTTP
jgi:hypothetical protein